MRPRLICLFICILGLQGFAPDPSLAATWIVQPDGSGHFATIQDAVTTAGDGDTIELTAGTFTGPGNRDIDLLGKAITIRSQSGDPDSCIIDCQGGPGSPHRGFRFHSGEDLSTELIGLTIANGYVTSSGGGVSCTSGSSPLIRDCTFLHNFAGTNGGALYCTNNSNLTLEDCRFIENTAEIYGGAIRCYQSSPTLSSCLFQGNVGPFGGGFSCYRNCAPELTDCGFQNNESVHGGGMFSYDSAALLTSCTFVENSSLAEGGGFANFDSSPEVTDCLFVDNTGNEAGGGFYAGGDGHSWITGSTFQGNSSNLGGGAYAHYSTLTMVGCTLVENSAGISGSGIYVAYTPLVLERVILAFGQGAPAIQCVGSDNLPYLSCCDIYGHPQGDWTGCVADQLGIRGNISADPFFCQISAGDFTLHADSPCEAENSSGCGLIGAWPVGCGEVSDAAPFSPATGPLRLRNHPNPFNPVTWISYRLAEPAMVQLRIFDLQGRVVRELEAGAPQTQGSHSLRWDGHGDFGQPLPSGVYYCRLDAAGQTQTRKMLLVK